MTTPMTGTRLPSATFADPTGLTVRFVAADGVEKVFSFADFPAPGFHTDLAAAYRTRCDSGEVRSAKTATYLYHSTRRFLAYLSQLSPAPGSVEDLTPDHLRDYHAHRSDRLSQKVRDGALWDACRLLRLVSPADRLSNPLRVHLALSRTASEWQGALDVTGQPVTEADPDNPLHVLFTAVDGQQHLFNFGTLPLPALHSDLAPAFTTLLYRDGVAISLSSAKYLWTLTRRMLTQLSVLDEPPACVSEVRPDHLEPLRLELRQRTSARHAASAFHEIRNLLANVRPYERLSAELRRDLEHALCAPAPDSAEPTEGPSPKPGKGRASAMPEGPYEPQAPAAAAATSLTVTFIGEDGRRSEYDFSSLPFPAFHPEFASAFAARTGPTGALRTRASADTFFGSIRRFLAFMDTLAQPPAALSELTVRHLERFRLHRMQSSSEKTAMQDLTVVRLLLRHVTPPDVLSEDLQGYISHPGLLRGFRKKTGVPGYSDREFRDLMAAARSEAVAIRERIRKGERLLETFRTSPDSLTSDERTLASHLDTMDRTGFVPLVRTDLRRPVLEGRLRLARHLFLTQTDLAPLVILAAGLSGRNAETIKDLPAEHRMLEDQAVAVNLTKRRRGKTLSRETVHWETGGSDSRQLHTPGGFYLLLHELTARSRRFSGSSRIWSIWAGTSGRRGTNWDAKLAASGHIDPFAQRLGRTLGLKDIAERHGLRDDNGEPLTVSLNRIKTTVEVRHTKAMGGHLPSASRTNTLDVSFAHYLQGDPVVREWAEEILTTALNEAEHHARGFRPHVITPAETDRLVQAPRESADALGTTPETLHQALDGQLDTVATSCLDIEHSPFSDGRCDVSFLTCLRCPNALITHQHLPALLALVDELDRARQAMPLDTWVHEHGRTWLALTRLILPQFTDAEQAEAAKAKPASLGLDLLDGPKELG